MKSEIDVLIEGFSFDRWANKRWLPYLEDRQLGEPERTIFQHILSAQDVWSRRIEGVSLTTMPKFEATEAKIDELHERWVRLLRENPDDLEISYTRTTGELHTSSMTLIARHVIDHGTYHRGELRGLCRARNDENFPETGLIALHLFGDSA